MDTTIDSSANSKKFQLCDVFNATTIFILLGFASEFLAIYIDDMEINSIVLIFTIVFLAIARVCAHKDNAEHELVGEPVWRTIEPDRLMSFVSEAKKGREQPIHLRLLNISLGNNVILFGGLVFAFFAYCLDDLLSTVFLINLAMLPGCALNAFKDPEFNLKLVEKELETLKVVLKEAESTSFRLRTQLCLRKDKEGQPVIQDKLRALVEYDNSPENWLSCMFSFNQTDVKGTKYPYLYFVLVAKGEGAALDRDYSQRIRDTFAGSKDWTLEVKAEDGNSIFVIRKSDYAFIPYCTKLKDEVPALVHIVDSVCQLERDWSADTEVQPRVEALSNYDDGEGENDENDEYEDDEDYSEFDEEGVGEEESEAHR